MKLPDLLCGCFMTPRCSVDAQAGVPQEFIGAVTSFVPKQMLTPKVDVGGAPIGACIARDSANIKSKERFSRRRLNTGVGYVYWTPNVRVHSSSRAIVGGTDYESIFVNPLAEGSHEGGVPIPYAGAALGAASFGMLGNPLAVEYNISTTLSPASSASNSPILVKVRTITQRGSDSCGGSGCAAELESSRALNRVCPSSQGTPPRISMTSVVSDIAICSGCSGSLLLPTDHACCVPCGPLATSLPRNRTDQSGVLPVPEAEAENMGSATRQYGISPNRNGIDCSSDSLPEASLPTPGTADACAGDPLAFGVGIAAQTAIDRRECKHLGTVSMSRLVAEASCGWGGEGGSALQAPVPLNVKSSLPSPDPPCEYAEAVVQYEDCTLSHPIANTVPVTISSAAEPANVVAPEGLAPCTPPLGMRDSCSGGSASSATDISAATTILLGARESWSRGQLGPRQLRSDYGGCRQQLPYVHQNVSAPPSPPLPLNGIALPTKAVRKDQLLTGKSWTPELIPAKGPQVVAKAVMAPRPAQGSWLLPEAGGPPLEDAEFPLTPCQEVEPSRGEAAKSRPLSTCLQFLPACLSGTVERQPLPSLPAVPPTAMVSLMVSDDEEGANAEDACSPLQRTLSSAHAGAPATLLTSARETYTDVSVTTPSSLSSLSSVFLPPAPSPVHPAISYFTLPKTDAAIGRYRSILTNNCYEDSASDGGAPRGCRNGNVDGIRFSTEGGNSICCGTTANSGSNHNPVAVSNTSTFLGPARRPAITNAGCSISGLAMTRMLIRQLGLLPPGTSLAFKERSLQQEVSSFTAVVCAADEVLCDGAPSEVTPAAYKQAAVQEAPSRVAIDDGDPIVSDSCLLRAQPDRSGSPGGSADRVTSIAPEAAESRGVLDGNMHEVTESLRIFAADKEAAGPVGRGSGFGCDDKCDCDTASMLSTMESNALFEERSIIGLNVSASQSWLEPQSWRPLREKFRTGGGARACVA